MNKLANEILITQWESKQLLKESIIAFVLAFTMTLVISFLAIWILSGASGIASIFIYLLSVPNNLAILSAFMVSFIQIAGWIAVISIRHYIKFKERIRLTKSEYSKFQLIGLGSFLALTLTFAPTVLNFFYNLVGIPEDTKSKVDSIVILYPILSLLFLPVIGAFEEVFFRGVLQNELTKTRVKAAGAILISSLVFTALHGFQYGVRTLISVFVMSIILGVFFYKFKSLAVNMIGHYLNNFIGVALIILSAGSITNAQAVNDSEKEEFNIFVNMMVNVDEGTSPYEVKYNAMFPLIRHCEGDTHQKIYNEIIMSNEKELSQIKIKYTGDLKLSTEERRNLNRKIENVYFKYRIQPFLTKCDFDKIKVEFDKNITHLSRSADKDNKVFEIISQYKSIGRQIGIYN